MLLPGRRAVTQRVCGDIARKQIIVLVPPAGLEPATSGLEGRRSIQAELRRRKVHWAPRAGDESRTRDIHFGRVALWPSELLPHWYFESATGIEPAMTDWQTVVLPLTPRQQCRVGALAGPDTCPDSRVRGRPHAWCGFPSSVLGRRLSAPAQHDRCFDSSRRTRRDATPPWLLPGSNWGPCDFQSHALPTELRSRMGGPSTKDRGETGGSPIVPRWAPL